MNWENTFLDNVSNYGSGPNPMGSGTYGTNWKQPAPVPVTQSSQWKSTYLEAVATYGGVELFGAGTYGTNWKFSL